MSAPRPAGALRLLTWNIHKGIGGVDRRYDLDRTAAVIAHYRPDVLCLQEVDDGAPRTRGHSQHHELAERLGYEHVAFAPTHRLKVGRYGNAILSRVPLVKVKTIDLTFPLKKTRGAIHAELVVPRGPHHLSVHLVNTHLGLAGVERRWQVKRLLEQRALARLNARSRLVIAGDTNDWTGALPGGRLGREGFDCVTGVGRSALATFPAWAPVGALDRVFTRGRLRLQHLVRPRLSLARSASDHLPVLVDLELLR